MKKGIVFCLVMILAVSLTSCGCEHTFTEATCMAPQTCTQCNKTVGEVLPHTWQAATCSAPQTCSSCKLTQGEPLPHTWKEATCTTAKTCVVCGATEGGVAGHQWKEATCTTPKTCVVCTKTEGKALGHNKSTAVCSRCKMVFATFRDGTYAAEYVENGSYVYTNVQLYRGSYSSTNFYRWHYYPASTYGSYWGYYYGNFTYQGTRYLNYSSSCVSDYAYYEITADGDKVIVKSGVSIVATFTLKANGSLVCTGSGTANFKQGITYYPYENYTAACGR